MARPRRRLTPTQGSWRNMWGRCTNSLTNGWKHYGGRGITVCERWRDFETFLLDMGKRPDGTTLDRIDSAGNYEPGNCRWATLREQSQNRRRRRKKKPVNPAASALAKLRWSRTPKAERSEPARKAIQARWAKARQKKAD